MKNTKDWFSLQRQSTTLLLVNLLICSSPRIKSRRKARAVAALLVGLYLGAIAAHAQVNGTWIGTTSDWNIGTNWSSAPTVPTGTAKFDASGITNAVTFSQDTSIGTQQFNAPTYTFDLPDSFRLTITTSGILSTPANAPTFNVTSLGNPALVFESGTAGPAIFNVTNTADMEFHGMSAAGNATINARPGQPSIRATVGPRITQLNFHLRGVPVQKRTQTPHSRCG